MHLSPRFGMVAAVGVSAIVASSAWAHRPVTQDVCADHQLSEAASVRLSAAERAEAVRRAFADPLVRRVTHGARLVSGSLTKPGRYQVFPNVRSQAGIGATVQITIVPLRPVSGVNHWRVLKLATTTQCPADGIRAAWTQDYRDSAAVPASRASRAISVGVSLRHHRVVAVTPESWHPGTLVPLGPQHPLPLTQNDR